MVKLNSINESFERLYGAPLNESVILTEAFNESFPDWLKTSIIRSRNQFGTIDRRGNRRLSRDYSNSNRASFRDKRDDYRRDSEKSLFSTAMKAGFFDVTVKEGAKPEKASDPRLKDPYIPIWGFPNQQVYIPGFNDEEKFNYWGNRGALPSDYSKFDGRAFGGIATKWLIEMAIHFAYFDKNDLDAEGFEKLNQERNQRLADLKTFYDSNPEYIRISDEPKGNDAYSSKYINSGETPDYFSNMNSPSYGYQVNNDRAYGRNRRTSGKYDKSGYLVPTDRYEQRLRGLKGKKLGRTLEQLHDDILSARQLLTTLMRSQNVWDYDKANFDSQLVDRAVKLIGIIASEYNSSAYTASTISPDSSDANERYGAIYQDLVDGSYYNAFYSIFADIKKKLDAEPVDWLS